LKGDQVPKTKNPPISCDWKSKPCGSKQNPVGNKSRVYRYKGDFKWKGIKTESYKPGKGAWYGILRRTLIGNHGETAKFHLRYFEIAPGGYSSFEAHKHEHVVVGIRGRGVCLTDSGKYRIGFLDTVYVEPDMPHQLRNPFKEPFGFFCIVNSRRDRPKIL
jgi:ribulose-bisphosphate carboxylase large chain